MHRKTSGGLMIGGLLGGSRLRGVLSAVAAAGIVGGAGLGIAAASGNEPVRNLLRISSDSAIKVEFTGVVVEASASELRVDVAGDLRVVALDGNTSITRSGDPAGIDALAPGTAVEVHGRLLPDNSIVATRVNIEDDDEAGSPTVATTPTADPTAATTSVPSTPNAQPTDDHGDDDQGEDEDSGPGSGDDQGEDEDGGPGAGDDVGEDDDSGPGSSDDEADEDTSGPGSGEDSEEREGIDDSPDAGESEEEPDSAADNSTSSSDDGAGEHLSDSGGGEVDVSDD